MLKLFTLVCILSWLWVTLLTWKPVPNNNKPKLSYHSISTLVKKNSKITTKNWTLLKKRFLFIEKWIFYFLSKGETFSTSWRILFCQLSLVEIGLVIVEKNIAKLCPCNFTSPLLSPHEKGHQPLSNAECLHVYCLFP